MNLGIKLKFLNTVVFLIQLFHIFGASPDGIVEWESENKNYVGRMLEIKMPWFPSYHRILSRILLRTGARTVGGV